MPAAVLFFTAPFVAEFLLGNLPLKLLPAMVLLAPMYGGGALLIRELARGAGRGWPSMLLLGAAYTLVEEGFVTQSLFNHDYLRMQMHLLDHAYVGALGMSAWWTLFMFNLHTFWSIGVSIALVEATVPERAEGPWMGRVGRWIVAVVFFAGVGANFAFTRGQEHFQASAVQWLATGVVCGLLVVCAFLLPRRERTGSRAVAPAWLVAVALLGGFAVLMIPPRWNWGAVGAMFAVDVVFLLFLAGLSRSVRWTRLHTLGVAAGGALAYGLHAFLEKPVIGGTGAVVRVGNGIFLAVAVGLMVLGWRRTARSLPLSAG